MSATIDSPRLPATFNRLAWSNLAAQSAEQIALAAAPIVAVLLLGVGEGQTGLLQTALTLPFILFAIPAGLLADRFSRRFGVPVIDSYGSTEGGAVVQRTPDMPPGALGRGGAGASGAMDWDHLRWVDLGHREDLVVAETG